MTVGSLQCALASNVRLTKSSLREDPQRIANFTLVYTVKSYSEGELAVIPLSATKHPSIQDFKLTFDLERNKCDGTDRK